MKETICGFASRDGVGIGCLAKEWLSGTGLRIGFTDLKEEYLFDSLLNSPSCSYKDSYHNALSKPHQERRSPLVPSKAPVPGIC